MPWAKIRDVIMVIGAIIGCGLGVAHGVMTNPIGWQPCHAYKGVGRGVTYGLFGAVAGAMWPITVFSMVMMAPQPGTQGYPRFKSCDY